MIHRDDPLEIGFGTLVVIHYYTFATIVIVRAIIGVHAQLE
jgi:hypothetical protein